MRPEKMRLANNIDLKLGIKSSLPKVKSALALIYSFWKSNNRKNEVIFSDETGTALVIKNEINIALKEYFKDVITNTGITSVDLESKINKNVVLTSQVEALKVAFELIWRIAIVKFEDESKSFNAERQGGTRYSKKLLFTKNVDIIDLLIQTNEEEYKKILFNWLTDIDTGLNANLEKELVRAFTLISEEAIYRLRIDEDNDIKFLNSGIYERYQLGTEQVDVADFKENMGSLRILHNLLKENLNYFLSRDGNSAVLRDTAILEELKEYTKRVNHYLDLVNVNIQINPREEDSPRVEETTEEYTANSMTGTNTIFYGAPGTGKSHTLEGLTREYQHVERVTFYPEYTHDDFIGSFMPSMSFDKKEKGDYVSLDGTEVTIPGKPIPYYTFVPGPLTNALIEALKDTSKKVLLIVEELNRANAAAVFGGFFQLLDRTSSGNSKYSISISNEYSEFIASKVVTYSKGNKLSLPANLSICATMNSADQGVNPLDSAFKRRWNFVYVPIDFSKATHKDFEIDYAQQKITWESFATTINNELKKKDVNEDKHLGQYFVTESEVADPYKFASKVLLYLFDDVLKFNRRGFFKNEFKTFSDLLTAFLNGKDVFDNFKFSTKSPDANPSPDTEIGESNREGDIPETLNSSESQLQDEQQTNEEPANEFQN